MKIRSKSMLNIFTLVALLASLLGYAVFVTPAYAAGLVVTKAADTNDGICNADCSLREAITAANANGSGLDLPLPLTQTTLSHSRAANCPL